MSVKNGDIIKINEDWDTYGMLAGEVYLVSFKNGNLVGLPKYNKYAEGLDVDDESDYTIIGNAKDNKDLIPAQYTKEEIDAVLKGE